MSVGLGAGRGGLRRAATPGVDPVPDWIARWRFDEQTGGVAADDGVTNGGDGWPMSNPNGFNWAVDGTDAGIIGRAVLCPQNSNKLLSCVPTSLIGGRASFSITMWVFNDTLPEGASYLARWGAAGVDRELLISAPTDKPSGLQIALTRANSLATIITRSDAVGIIKTGQWQHLVFTYDGTAESLLMYVDGVNVPGSLPADGGSVNTGSYPLVVGGRSENGSTFNSGMDGREDETRIYHRALTPAEIAELNDYRG